MEFYGTYPRLDNYSPLFVWSTNVCWRTIRALNIAANVIYEYFNSIAGSYHYEKSLALLKMFKALLHLYLISLFLKIMNMHCFKCCRNEESTMKTKALCCCDRVFVDKFTIDRVFKWLLSNSWLTACQKQLMWFIIRCVLCCGNRAIVTLITLLSALSQRIYLRLL